MAVTKTQVQNALTLTPTQAQEMYATLDQAGGWSGVEQQTVSSVASTITRSGGGHPVLDQTLSKPGMARLLLVDAACVVAATATAVFGLWALFPPATVFAGILAVGFGVLTVIAC